MLQTMREQGMGIAAPFLGIGDVLFWNSLTVHGSLAAANRLLADLVDGALPTKCRFNAAVSL